MSENIFRSFINGKKGQIVVCDIDEVITFQTPKWCKLIYQQLKDDKEVNEQLIISEALLDPVVVLSRPYYYLSEWLKRPEIDVVDKHINDKLLEVYNSEPDFYIDTQMTSLGNAMEGLVHTDLIDKIYYVSKGDRGLSWDSKLKMIEEKVYVDKKTEIIRVPLECSKSDYVKKYIPNYDQVALLIEDEPKNIYNMLDDCFKTNNLLVLSPVYGYTIQANMNEEKIKKYYEENKSIRMYYNK